MEKKIPTCPTTAAIDADIIAYRVAFRAESDDPAFIPQMIEEYLENWLPAETNEFTMCLSCSRSDNYRRDIWPRYKTSRDGQDTPEYLSEVKDYMIDVYNCEYIDKLEADDILGMDASAYKSVAVTIDKDLRGVPGWHFNPDKEDAPVHVTEEEADKFFLVQWMSGDSTDTIPGLWRIGHKRALSFLKKWEGEDIIQNIIEMYSDEKYIPKHTCDLEDLDLALAMARCVRILRNGDYDPITNEIDLWVPKVGV
jgi:DNA polymerase-1